VLWRCWLGGRKGIRPVKSGGWWRWALLSPDGVVPSRMVGMSASVNLPLHHKVQKFSSGTGSPGWSWKKGHKAVLAVVVLLWYASVHTRTHPALFDQPSNTRLHDTTGLTTSWTNSYAVWQPAVYTIEVAECLYTRYNRSSNWLDNRFDNRLYHVNGA